MVENSHDIVISDQRKKVHPLTIDNKHTPLLTSKECLALWKRNRNDFWYRFKFDHESYHIPQEAKEHTKQGLFRFESSVKKDKETLSSQLQYFGIYTVLFTLNKRKRTNRVMKSIMSTYRTVPTMLKVPFHHNKARLHSCVVAISYATNCFRIYYYRQIQYPEIISYCQIWKNGSVLEICLYR